MFHKLPCYRLLYSFFILTKSYFWIILVGKGGGPILFKKSILIFFSVSLLFGGLDFQPTSFLPQSVYATSPTIEPTIVSQDGTTLYLRSDGAMFGWGFNNYGTIGDGSRNSVPSPTFLSSSFKKIAMGGANFSAGIDQNDTLWMWGRGEWGNVGNGQFNSFVTSKVAVLDNVKDVALATYHTIALKKDGTVWTWGSNGSGQLGDGTLSDRATPMQVAGLTMFHWL
jgi:alpha-tubulin suppressor-like RCC1 family protein